MKDLNHQDAKDARVAETMETLSQWQIQEIKAALEEADAGKFATEQEVRAVMERLLAAEAAQNGSDGSSPPSQPKTRRFS
jgi:predicted transcriptional regulator